MTERLRHCGTISERAAQFLEHVLARIKSIYHVDSVTSSPTAIDSQMIESAAAYIAALSKDGRNFTGNEYVKLHVIEALIHENVNSMRALSMIFRVMLIRIFFLSKLWFHSIIL